MLPRLRYPWRVQLHVAASLRAAIMPALTLAKKINKSSFSLPDKSKDEWTEQGSSCSLLINWQR